MPLEKIMVRNKYLDRIRPYYETDLIKVLVGPRRSGKSMILKTIKSEIDADDEHKIMINFEDMDYHSINDASKLNDFIREKIKDGRYYLFFDEIQHVKEFEMALASFKVKYDCSIFVTGSNSTLLSGELASLLVGRTKEFLIMPFSYSEAKEYMMFLGKELPNHFFKDYLRMGGYPQRFQYTDETAVREYLEELYESIIVTDVLKRRSSSEKEKLKHVASFVLSNSGSRFSAQNVVDYLNNTHNSDKYISLQTVYNYLERMEKAFLIKRTKKYNVSGKKIMDSFVKNYALDNGLSFINTNSMDLRDTFFLETLVYDELISRGYEVYVGETYKAEVDFVVIKNGKKCFVQIAYLMTNDETIEREFGAFSPIKSANPKYVLSLDELDMSRDGIVHYNIIDFLDGRADLYLT